MSFYIFQLNQNIEKYETLLSQMRDYTVYHTQQFLLAEETAEENAVNIFVYEDECGIAIMPNILRCIGKIKGLEKYKMYYDIKTPHEYSGVLCSTADDRVYQKFFIELEKYCKSNQIIFQFIRFNPYRFDHQCAGKTNYNINFCGNQIYIDLERKDDEIFQSYKPSVRRNIRRAVNAGLYFQIQNSSDKSISIFMELYQKSMEYLSAKKFFYFNEKYFSHLIKADVCSTLLFVKYESAVIAAAILLKEKNMIYYHLGCFDREYSSFRPMDYLYYSIVKFGLEEKKNKIHLGGGHESLYRFKAGFSPDQVIYYIGTKIFDYKIYNEICNEFISLYPDVINSNFMPLYRSKE